MLLRSPCSLTHKTPLPVPAYSLLHRYVAVDLKRRRIKIRSESSGDEPSKIDHLIEFRTARCPTSAAHETSAPRRLICPRAPESVIFKTVPQAAILRAQPPLSEVARASPPSFRLFNRGANHFAARSYDLYQRAAPRLHPRVQCMHNSGFKVTVTLITRTEKARKVGYWERLSDCKTGAQFKAVGRKFTIILKNFVAFIRGV
jgi:hypothetical protein